MDIITLALAKNAAAADIATAIAALPKGLVYRGAVDYQTDLPDNAEIGDAYTVKYKGSSGVTPDGAEYVWGTYDQTNQWIKLGGDGALSVVYTKSNNAITCNQSYTDIVNTINQKQSIIGWYVDGSTVQEISQFIKQEDAVGALYDLGASQDGQLSVRAIAHTSDSISEITNALSVLPSVTSSDNGSVAAVVSGSWGKSQIKTINNQSLVGTGNINTTSVVANQQVPSGAAELTSLTIDGTTYKVASESGIYNNLLSTSYGTPVS